MTIADVRDLIVQYRHHALSARRMVALRNRKHIVSGIDAYWSERSLGIYDQHADRMRAIARELCESGRDEIAEALRNEERAQNALNWRRLKINAGLGGEIEPRLTMKLATARRVLAAVAPGMPPRNV